VAVEVVTWIALPGEPTSGISGRPGALSHLMLISADGVVRVSRSTVAKVGFGAPFAATGIAGIRLKLSTSTRANKIDINLLILLILPYLLRVKFSFILLFMSFIKHKRSAQLIAALLTHSGISVRVNLPAVPDLIPAEHLFGIPINKNSVIAFGINIGSIAKGADECPVIKVWVYRYFSLIFTRYFLHLTYLSPRVAFAVIYCSSADIINNTI